MDDNENLEKKKTTGAKHSKQSVPKRAKHSKESSKTKKQEKEDVKEKVKNEENNKKNEKKQNQDKKDIKVKTKNKKSKENKIPKEISQEMLKKMFWNVLKAVIITFYFMILNIAYSVMNEERLINDIEVFASVFLLIGIIFIEKAYKKDSGSNAITGVEFLVLSLHSLSIMHIITLFKYDFRFYLLTSSYVFSIYYVLKAIILYTKATRDYLHSLSDIPEIVKKDEPIKKEARKRNNIKS